MTRHRNPFQVILCICFLSGCATTPVPAPARAPAAEGAAVEPDVIDLSSFSQRSSVEIGSPRALAIGPEGRYLLYAVEEHVTRDGGTFVEREIRRIDLEEGSSSTVGLEVSLSTPTALAIAPDRRAFAVAASGAQLAIVGFEDGAVLHAVDCIYVDPDHEVCTSRAPQGSDIQFTDLAYISGGSRLVAITSNELIWWDAATGEQVARAEQTISHPRLSAARDGAVAVAVPDGVMIFRDGAPEATCTFTDAVTTLALSPDGTRVAAAFRDGPVRVWRIDACDQLAEWSPQTSFVPRGGMDWTPDGEHLVTSGDGVIRIWRAATGELVHHFQAHDGVAPFVMSDAGRRLLTWGDRDAEGRYTARLWEAQPAG